MASIQERKAEDGTISYRVQIRIKGQPSVSETFKRKSDAKRWAAKTEAEIRERKYFRSADAQRKTLKDAIERYLKLPIVRERKTFHDKKSYLEWWKKELGNYFLADLTPSVVAEKRDKLLNQKTRRGTSYSPASVNRYLAALSHLCGVAVKEWGWLELNPVSYIAKPREPRGRDRYLSDGERKRLLNAVRKSDSPYLYPIVLLALSTGMRRGEILGLTWNDVDFPNSRITLRETKNDEVRSLPIIADVEVLLKKLRKIRRIDTDLVFPSSAGDRRYEFKTAWKAVLNEAKIENFRFHDLRHSCASYLAMNGATTAEIAAVLGHKTLAMVKRYSHLSDSHTASVVVRMNEKMLSNV